MMSPTTHSGGALSLGGAGLLGFHYWDVLLPLVAPATGTALLLVGGGMLLNAADGASSSKSLNMGGNKKGGRSNEWRLKLVPLNDEIRFATAMDDIARGRSSGEGGGGGNDDDDDKDGDSVTAALFADVEGPLATAEKEATQQRLEVMQARRAALAQDVVAELDNGVRNLVLVSIFA
jgi:hypothetical protein